MINGLTCKTAHHFGSALSSQYELRHKAFISRQSWDLNEYNGMEYDPYDTPATTYLVWQDDQQVVRGVSRLVPTSQPYMLKDLWPESVTKIQLPNTPHILEGSRFCIDPTLPPLIRQQISYEIVCAYLEYGLLFNIKSIIGIMHPIIWRKTFINAGWEVDFIGSNAPYGGKHKNIAGKMTVSQKNLNNVRLKTGISTPILNITPFNSKQSYERLLTVS